MIELLRATGCLLALAACLAANAPAGDFAGGSAPVMYVDYSEPVAVVGASRITMGNVMELWSPLWSETLARVRTDRLTVREGDQRLHEEWSRAIDALIRDEVLYQEADLEFSSMLNEMARQHKNAGAVEPQNQIVAMLRREMNVGMQRDFQRINARAVREAGGRYKLESVLQSRNMSFNDWQNRLRKKAFTETYLSMTLGPSKYEPRPRDIREYRDEHTEEYYTPGTVRFRHIFFSNAARGEEEAREDAAAVWEMLAANEITFEEAARTYSDDEESKARGGMETEREAADLEREAWLSDIRSALREEKPDELGPILETPFGCHVAVLVAIGSGQKMPWTEVRDDIVNKLEGRMREQAVDERYARLRRQFSIRTRRDSFPRHLSCAAQQSMLQGPMIINTTRPEIRAARRIRR